MGWTKYDLENENKLYTRGGFEQVHIELDCTCYDHPIINIPESLLLHLMAEHIRSKIITKIEQMEDKELINSVCQLF